MLAGMNPQTITDLEGARQAIGALLNLVEELKQENQRMRETLQQQRDEINRAQRAPEGEQGRPEIKEKKDKSPYSSEKERQARKAWKKGSKHTQIKIDRTETLKVAQTILPADAEFKGYEAVVVQDISIHSDTVRFLKESTIQPQSRRAIWLNCPSATQGSLGLESAPWC